MREKVEMGRGGLHQDPKSNEKSRRPASQNQNETDLHIYVYLCIYLSIYLSLYLDVD